MNLMELTFWRMWMMRYLYIIDHQYRDNGQSADHEESRRLWIEVVVIRSRLVLVMVSFSLQLYVNQVLKLL